MAYCTCSHLVLAIVLLLACSGTEGGSSGVASSLRTSNGYRSLMQFGNPVVVERHVESGSRSGGSSGIPGTVGTHDHGSEEHESGEGHEHARQHHAEHKERGHGKEVKKDRKGSRKANEGERVVEKGHGHEDHGPGHEEHEGEHEKHEGEHDHHEGEHGHHVDEEHIHDSNETPAEHIILTFGARGQIIEEELQHIFERLSGDSHDEHGHAGHDHGHHKDHGRTVSPESILHEYGVNDGLDEQGIIDACPMLLSCQLDDECELVSGHDDDDDDDDDNAVLLLKIVSAVVFFIEVIVGGMVPLVVGQFEKLSVWLSFLNSFSGGIFMGAGFIHMLPEVQEAQLRLTGLREYPLGGAMVVAGFMLIFFLEHVLFQVHEHTQMSPPMTSAPQNQIKAVNDLVQGTRKGANTLTEALAPVRGPLVLLLAISVHSLFEALALGLQTNRNGVLLLLATVGSHKGVAAMALSARFVREGASWRQVIMFLCIFSVVAPLGILSGVWVSGVPDLVLLILNGLSAGTFIYIGAYEVISDEFGHKGHNTENKYIFQKYLAVVFGVLLMALLQLIPHEH